jgi:hypothetical protein
VTVPVPSKGFALAVDRLLFVVDVRSEIAPQRLHGCDGCERRRFSSQNTRAEPHRHETCAVRILALSR